MQPVALLMQFSHAAKKQIPITLIDGKKTTSAFLTATFHVIGFFFPCSLQLCKAVPVLWTVSGLPTLRWGAVPRAAQGTAPAAVPGWWSLSCIKRGAQQLHPQGCLPSLQQPYVASVPGYCDSQILSAVLLPLCTCAFHSVSTFHFTLFHLNFVLICCLVTLLLSFPSPEVKSGGLLITGVPFPCLRSWRQTQ